MPQTTRTFFAFSIEKTGELVRLVEHEDRGPRYSTESHYSLTRDPSFPVFEAESAEALALVLFENTPSYNTRPELPGWGDVRPDELVAVQVMVTEESKPVALPRLLNLKTVSIRDIPYLIARKYAGGDFEQRADRPGLVFWLVELPDGDTLDSVRAEWTGKVVFGGDRYTRRHVYACAAVPEDYIDLLEGKNGALLIASGSFYL